mgnify:FL=1
MRYNGHSRESVNRAGAWKLRKGNILASIKLLGIAGSLRQASTNRGLLRAAQQSLPPDTRFEIADLTDIPFYNQDISVKPAAV